MVIMAALRSRCGHYIFALWFLYLLSSSIFFFSSPNLNRRIKGLSVYGSRVGWTPARRIHTISAVADWMSTILAHMVWPSGEFKMQVWNVLHGARCKYRTQKVVKKSPSGHYRTTLSDYIFATKACIGTRKKLLSSNIFSTNSYNMVKFGPLAAEIDPVVWGTRANFNGFHVLAALLHGI